MEEEEAERGKRKEGHNNNSSTTPNDDANYLWRKISAKILVIPSLAASGAESGIPLTPLPRRSHSASLLRNNLYVFGGYVLDNRADDSIYILDLCMYCKVIVDLLLCIKIIS